MLPIRNSKLIFLFLFLSITLFAIYYSKSVHAYTTNGVYVQNNKLFIGGQEFYVRGVNYNPVAIGSDQIDASAPIVDVPKMAALKANTIGTYNVGQFEWGQWSNVSAGVTFYTNLYPVAEQNNMKIIVGYFSNQTIDWTNPERVAKVTAQYQALVTRAKSRPSTLVYLIGNEIFEVLPSDAQRVAYAQWIGRMVDWTHSNDPDHPVTYADNALHSGLPWLKNYAPNLDVYSLNNYEWSNATELNAILSYDASAWPGKPLLLHEWGVDSFNVNTWSENESLQSGQITSLAKTIDQLHSQNTYPFIGSLLFEYSDQWDKVGGLSTQDPDQGWPWACKTCFDGRANQDYWGIARSANSGQSTGRIMKQSYYSLQSVWNNLPVPSVSASSVPMPTKTPSPTVTPRPKKHKG